MATIKTVWLVAALITGIACMAIEFFGPIFFINRTASMPQGIYAKNGGGLFKKGDIIIFNEGRRKSNLIKYIAAVSGDRYCFDEAGALWVNEIPIAQKNIEKYSQPFLAQSICNILNEGELLVIGDHENSYDSRYFGPIKKNDVIATAKLLWKIK